jgi:hypothetical protein
MGCGGEQMKNSHRIRVFNDSGIAHTTEITWADTGEKVPGVRAVTIDIQNTKIITATLTINIPVVDVVGYVALSEQTKRSLRRLMEIVEDIDDRENV